MPRPPSLRAVAVVAAMALLPPGAARAADPEAQWPLDAATPGGTVVDTSGNGLNAELRFGAAVVGGGRFGGALDPAEIQNQSSGAWAPSSPALEPTRLSVVAWVKRTGSPGTYRYLVGKGANGCSGPSYALYANGNGRLQFVVSNGAAGRVSPEAPVSVWDGAWHAVTGVWDGTVPSLYVDGTLVAGEVAGGGTLGYGLPTGELAIGTYPGAAQCAFPTGWPGLVDEVRVYSRTLSAAEIAYLHDRRHMTPPSLPIPPPLVRTTGADEVTVASARVSGSIDDRLVGRRWHVEYGQTTAYGQRTGEFTTGGAVGAQPVQAVLSDLAPGTAYHARVVADGAAGEDVAFRTTDAAAGAASVPAGLDFTWNPRAEVLIAGAPAGGVQFDATAAPGVTYLWDFDSRAGQPFRPDPSASGPSPRHAFTADGAHDTNRAKGADGGRRRVYTVRLRAIAPDGTSAEAEHHLVVMPNGAPVVDFVTRRPSLTVSKAVTLLPRAADPDAGPKTADRLVRLEWDLDTPAGEPGNLAATDIVCDGAGAACTGPDGAPLGDWFAPGPNGAISVNFFTRGLAANRLRPLAQIDLGALPERGPDGGLLTGALAVQSFQGRSFSTQKDPRLAYLYDNATLLQQSSFNTDAGEATGAQLARGTLRAKRASSLKGPAIRRQDKLLESSGLSWRRVTLTATDSAGIRTSASRAVPLVPDAAPRLQAKFLNLDPRRRAVDLANPQVQPRTRARARAAQKQQLGYTLTTQDEIVYDAFASDDPDGQIAWYTLEVGQPLRPPGLCQPTPKAETTLPPLIPTPEEYRPGRYQPQINPAGAGAAGPRGRVGDIPAKGPNARKLAAFRAVGAPDKPLSALLAESPLLHACGPFSQRNVEATSFLARPSAAVRPVPMGAIRKELLQPRGDRTFPTKAIVTKDPNDLRFTIPVAGTYSVAIGAYDESGLGAIQRTDGLKIFDAEGDCVNVSGEPLTLGGRKYGFGGQCMSFSEKRTRFRTTQAISLNGVGLRPKGGGVLRIDTVARTLRVTQGDGDAPGDVEVVVDGDAVAQITDFTPARALDFVRGDLHPTVTAGAVYGGSPLARPSAPGPDPDNFRVTLGSGGTSTTRFYTVLPGEFSRTGESTSPTSEVRRRGREEPRSNEITTKRYADIASARRAQERRARARAAADASASTLDLSGTNLGPVSIDKGLLRFDPERGYWEGDLEVTLNVASPVTGLSMHLVIDDGELKEATGKAKTLIPLFAGVTLDELRFSIVSDPLTVSGGASASIIKVLRGDLDMTIRTGPVLFRLTGRISLFGELELGSAYVQYDEANDESLTFGGHLGLDFGPVSVGAGVDGGVSLKTGDFFVEGNGRACLFICLGVKALISSKALAACGSIDLLFVEISAGFAYRFGDGLEVFLGCDLAPYRPAVFRVRGGVTADAAQAGAGGLRVPAGAEQAAFRFRGNAAMAGAPKLTLTAPDGRTFSTGDLPGDYAFSPPGAGALASDEAGRGVATPTAVIDQDPVSRQTTVLVAKPPAGEWRVALAPGQPSLAGAEIALGEHVEDRELHAEVRDADLVGDTVKIGSTTAIKASSSKASAAATKLARLQVAALRQQPRIERSRFRGVVLDVPDGLDGELVLADVTPASTAIVRTLDLETYGGKKVPIAFRPTADPGTHQLRALLTHADGTPRQSIVVDSFAGPPIPPPTAPDLELSRSPGGTVVVDVRPGSAGAVTDAASSFDLAVQAPSGRRIERLVDRSNSRRLSDGAFRVTLGTFSASDFRGMRAWGRMLYAGTVGKVDAVRVARRAG
ncbi:MAG: LamG-like jellyroll fold domain-containing protein [Solirubrobacteraceae bacterium]